MEHSELAQACYAELLLLLEKPGPVHYVELDALLHQLRLQCLSLCDAFMQAGVAIPGGAIPSISAIPICEDDQTSFTATVADEWVNIATINYYYPIVIYLSCYFRQTHSIRIS